MIRRGSAGRGEPAPGAGAGRAGAAAAGRSTGGRYKAAGRSAAGRSGAGRAARIRIAALVAPERRDLIADLSHSVGRPIEVVGYLAAGGSEREIDTRAVEEQIVELADAGVPRVLLILHGDRAEVLPYSKNIQANRQLVGSGSDLRPDTTAC